MDNGAYVSEKIDCDSKVNDVQAFSKKDDSQNEDALCKRPRQLVAELRIADSEAAMLTGRECINMNFI